jgi:hypothetical protein
MPQCWLFALDRLFSHKAPNLIVDATGVVRQLAIELNTVATQVVEGTALKVAEFPNKNVLNDFLLKSVGDTSRLDADVERSLTDTAG